MSVLIKDMGKPKSCYAVIDGEYEYCPFVNTDDDCVLLLKKGTCEGTWAGQYSKCPLIEAPELCEDAVSRQAAIDALGTPHGILYPIRTIEELPFVQPERLKGRWTDNNACPFCGFQPWYERDIHTLSFCPNCGAKMEAEA